MNFLEIGPSFEELLFQPEEPDKLYRVWSGQLYQSGATPKEFPWQDPPFDAVKFYFTVFPILRRTPAGAWIVDERGKERWVGGGSGKRYAHEKKEWALQSYLRRSYTSRARAQALLDKHVVAIPAAEALLAKKRMTQ